MPPTVPWTDGEVAAAKADCTKMLAGLTLDYEALPPIKEGMCGAPAPILLKAVGSDPKVEIDPPATVTCALAARRSAPGSARPSSPRHARYSARPSSSCTTRPPMPAATAMAATTTPLSEHALANALDISEFVFQSGERVTVLASWPRVVAVPPLPLPNPIRVAVATGDPPVAQHAQPAIEPDHRHGRPRRSPTRSRQPPPLAGAASAETRAARTAKSDFVRKVHDDACNIFGTVLGPEANDAHKNHFHLDMKARRRSAFCE